MFGETNTAMRRVTTRIHGRWFVEQECLKDPYCVAYAFSNNEETKSILYTSTKCESYCENVQWLENPDLIVSAKVKGVMLSEDDRDIDYISGWMNGECWRARGITQNLSIKIFTQKITY